MYNIETQVLSNVFVGGGAAFARAGDPFRLGSGDPAGAGAGFLFRGGGLEIGGLLDGGPGPGPSPSSAPEPETLVLVLAGVAAVVALRAVRLRARSRA